MAQLTRYTDAGSRITDEQADAAWAYIQRHCEDADEIGKMLGVIV